MGLNVLALARRSTNPLSELAMGFTSCNLGNLITLDNIIVETRVLAIDLLAVLPISHIYPVFSPCI
jgi:HAMP domain-containing protein